MLEKKNKNLKNNKSAKMLKNIEKKFDENNRFFKNLDEIKVKR